MSKLVSVFIQTNTFCNARCLICPYKDTYAKNKVPNGMMSLELYKKILSDLTKDYNGEIGLYFQYEPLMDKRLPQLFKLAKKYCPKSRTSISTNCSLLNDEWAKALTECDSLDYVYFNVLGGTKETYEKAMPPLKWELTIKNLNNFANQFNGNMYINFMKTNDNKDEIDSLRKVINKKVSIIEEYWASNRGGTIEINKPENVKTRYEKNENSCIPLDKRIYIHFDGIVPLCCQCWKREVIIGDINKENIYDIFNSDKKHTNYKICETCN